MLAFNPLPEWVRAEPSTQLAALWQHPNLAILPDAAALQAALEARLPRRISLVTAWGQQAAGLLVHAARAGRWAHGLFHRQQPAQ